MWDEPGIVSRTASLESITRLRPTPSAPALLINLIGAPHSGKSVLLHQCVALFEPTTPTLLLDFGRPPGYSMITRVPLASVATHLRESIAALAVSTFPMPEVVRDPTSDEVLAELPVGLYTTFRMVGRDEPLVVLLDNVQTFPAWSWLQSSFLLPLCKQPMLVVCASRTQLPWDHWQLRERCRVEEVPPFTPAEASRYFADHGGYRIPETVLPVFMHQPCYPDALQHVQRQLQKTSADWAVPASVALPLDSLPDSDPLLYYCGWLRALDNTLMLEVLNLPEVATQLPPTVTVSRSRLLRTLQRWRSVGYIYAGDTTERLVRCLRVELENHVRQHDPATYRAIVQHVVHVYEGRVRTGRTASDVTMAFLDWLAYATAAMLLNDADDAYAVWHRQLFAMLNELAVPGDILLSSLYHDQDVVALLADSGVLDAVTDVLRQQMVAGAPSVPLLQRQRENALQQRTVASWNSVPALALIREQYPGGVRGLLADIANLAADDATFTLQQLRGRMYDHAIAPAVMHEMLVAVQAAGLVQYQHTTHRCTVAPNVRYLLTRAAGVTTLVPHPRS